MNEVTKADCLKCDVCEKLMNSQFIKVKQYPIYDQEEEEINLCSSECAKKYLSDLGDDSRHFNACRYCIDKQDMARIFPPKPTVIENNKEITLQEFRNSIYETHFIMYLIEKIQERSSIATNDKLMPLVEILDDAASTLYGAIGDVSHFMKNN